MMRRPAAIALAAVGLVAFVSPDAALSVGRGDPVVIVGASLPKLSGVTADRLVAFRYRASQGYTQVPVQLDERKEVDFGSTPSTNATAGAEGTVYGTAPIGFSAPQYADAGTFVGRDPVSGLDDDDEVALIAADAGSNAAGAGRPGGTRGAATRVKISDPLGGPHAFIYLYRSDGELDPSAGRDYVRYRFRLASGDYRTTYKRADGPNPETSVIRTPSYSVGFSDRWYFDALSIRTGGVMGPDLLDGFKFQFGPTTCGRSEATFNDGEGAFVANIDGPVRAIRSYVGANSGPLTERTHIFWPDRQLLITDLRVHSGIPGPLTYHDLSAAGLGMTYRDSLNLGGVLVDGSPDAIADGVATWRQWTGSQGSLVSTDRVDSSFAEQLMAQAHNFYLDQANVPPSTEQTCWGDPHAYGQGGFWSTYPPPNTDPRLGPAATLRATTTDVIGAPGAGAADAAQVAARLDNPLQTAIN